MCIRIKSWPPANWEQREASVAKGSTNIFISEKCKTPETGKINFCSRSHIALYCYSRHSKLIQSCKKGSLYLLWSACLLLGRNVTAEKFSSMRLFCQCIFRGRQRCSQKLYLGLYPCSQESQPGSRDHIQFLLHCYHIPRMFVFCPFIVCYWNALCSVQLALIVQLEKHLIPVMEVQKRFGNPVWPQGEFPSWFQSLRLHTFSLFSLTLLIMNLLWYSISVFPDSNEKAEYFCMCKLDVNAVFILKIRILAGHSGTCQ